MSECIRNQLLKLSDKKYQIFQSKLSSGVVNILGVRIPLLRKLAGKISRGNWKRYIETAEDEYYEEVMLQGMVIGCVKISFKISVLRINLYHFSKNIYMLKYDEKEFL